jgi:hypothetical protein
MEVASQGCYIRAAAHAADDRQDVRLVGCGLDRRDLDNGGQEEEAEEDQACCVGGHDDSQFQH